MNEWPFGNLNPMSYDLILADPATRFETWSTAGESKSPQAQYDTMTWDELAEIVRLIDHTNQNNKQIAARYSITHSMISKIRTGNAWQTEVAAIRQNMRQAA